MMAKVVSLNISDYRLAFSVRQVALLLLHKVMTSETIERLFRIWRQQQDYFDGLVFNIEGTETMTLCVRCPPARSVMKLMGNGVFSFCGSTIYLRTLLQGILDLVSLTMSDSPKGFFKSLRTFAQTKHPDDSTRTDVIGDKIAKFGDRFERRGQGLQ